MWIETIVNSKGKRYKYSERFVDPQTGKARKVSVTLNSDSRHAQRMAVDMLREKLQHKGKQVETQECKMLYAVLDEWNESVRPHLKYSTYQQHGYMINTIKRTIGRDMPLKDFTPARVEKVVNELYYTRKQSKGRCNMVLNLIKTAFKYAKKAHYINDISEYMELSLAPRPATPEELNKKQNKFLSHEELASCLNQLQKMNQRVSLAAEFIALTGVRNGELAAFRPQDFHQQDKSITVSGSIMQCCNARDPKARTTPKNIYSYRSVHLSPRAMEIVQWFLLANKKAAAWDPAYKDIGYIFTDEQGTPLLSSNMRSYLLKVEIPGKHVTAHIFRHTFISFMAEQGAPLKAIMKQVGHNNPNTTLAVYTHVTDKLTKETEQMIDRLAVND
jgi:integrase